MQIKVTYYLDVISSWCYWAEPAWKQWKDRYSSVASFDWKITLLDPAALPRSREQEEWFFRRSGTVMRSPFMLTAGWFEPDATEYIAPNALAEAAKDFGIVDDRVRLALAEAALRRNLKVGRWEVAVPIAAKAAGCDADQLLSRARSTEIDGRLRASTAEFHALQVTQRPTFVVDDEIGDRAVFSGLARPEPVIATIEAMLADCSAYGSWKAHFGDPPAS